MTAKTGNHLLDSFSEDLKSTILRSAEKMNLPLRTSLFTSDKMPQHLYFVTSGLASVVVAMEEGGTSEVSMTGKDGLAGATTLLGSLHSSADCFMQLAGDGYRVPRRLMEQLFADSVEFRSRVLGWLQAVMNVSFQSTGCGRLHEAEARLARWLLMTSDRTEQTTMALTQEVLAEMLGTQRTTVALVAGQLKRAGFIEYTRGKVRILDRPGLESAACECYRVSREAIEQLYKPSV